MGKDAGNLYGEPLSAVTIEDLPVFLRKLRRMGHTIETRGRLGVQLYVNPECTRGLLTFRSRSAKARYRWKFQRIGKLSPRETAFVHKLGPTI